MQIPLYQVDAFTSRVFGGNPAAVCLPPEPLSEDLMQAIALENNLSETAFLTPATGDEDYSIRWFTPKVEVDLCGHATLAGAWVAFHRLGGGRTSESLVRFASRSGALVARQEHDRIVLDLPAQEPRPARAPEELLEGLHTRPGEVLRTNYWLAVYDAEAEVRELQPDFERLAALDAPVIATAPGLKVDFVSRFFAPGFGIAEDPVTGSAHCTLTPYWSRRLEKKILSAQQVSARGGLLRCDDHGARVHLAGRAALYLEGVVHV